MTSPTGTSPADTAPPDIDILILRLPTVTGTLPNADITQPHMGLSLQQLSALYTVKFTSHLEDLHAIQADSSKNRLLSQSISEFLAHANKTIAAISSLYSIVVEAKESENETSQQTEDTISSAYFDAVTAERNLHWTLGSGIYKASLAGKASQEMATDIGNYLKFVKAKCPP